MSEHFVIVEYIVELLFISGAVARAIAVLVKDASEIMACAKELREAFNTSFYGGRC